MAKLALTQGCGLALIGSMALGMLSLATGLSVSMAALPGVPGSAALAQGQSSSVDRPALSALTT